MHPYGKPLTPSSIRDARRPLSITVMLQRFTARLALASERYRQRCMLSELTDEQLRDVGLSRRDVQRECAKPFWDI
ncbi:protein of unknown function [Nitratireductor aquimarinus]